MAAEMDNALPPMIVVGLGLVLFSLEWLVARPWLIAILGLAGVALIFIIVYLRDLRRRQDDAAERDRLIRRESQRRNHRKGKQR